VVNKDEYIRPVTETAYWPSVQYSYHVFQYIGLTGWRGLWYCSDADRNFTTSTIWRHCDSNEWTYA